jgi:hypothetical protein
MTCQLARNLVMPSDETHAARHVTRRGDSAVDDGAGRMVASHRVDDDGRRWSGMLIGHESWRRVSRRRARRSGRPRPRFI